MEIPPILAAQLTALTQSLHDGADLEVHVRALAWHAMLAIRSFLGMTILISADGHQVGVTVRHDIAGRVTTSLRIPLDADGPGEPPVRVVLYAAVPGAFVDLAADLSFALAIDPEMLVLDGDLDAVPGPGVTGLAAHAAINQAVGMLLDQGHSRDSAHAALRRRAADDSGDLAAAAETVVRNNGEAGPHTQQGR